MARARVVLDHRGMRDLLNSRGVADDMLDRALNAAAQAEATAPIDSGEYQDSIHAVVVHTDRAVGRVIAEARHALVVEAKSRVLGRALDAARGD